MLPIECAKASSVILVACLLVACLACCNPTFFVMRKETHTTHPDVMETCIIYYMAGIRVIRGWDGCCSVRSDRRLCFVNGGTTGQRDGVENDEAGGSKKVDR